jgi:hypothetical protein
MPGTPEHLDQARRNEGFFSCIETPLYGDWAATVLFYTALHYVDAYLARQGHVDPGDHDTRDNLMKDFPATRAIWREYCRLKNHSRSARYYAARFSKVDITGLERGSLEPIRARMKAELTATA